MRSILGRSRCLSSTKPDADTTILSRVYISRRGKTGSAVQWISLIQRSLIFELANKDVIKLSAVAYPVLVFKFFNTNIKYEDLIRLRRSFIIKLIYEVITNIEKGGRNHQIVKGNHSKDSV